MPDTEPRHADEPAATVDVDELDLGWPEWLPQPRRGGRFWTVLVTFKKFSDDQLTDLAASLTYYAVLSLFPALIALLAVLSIFGQSDEVVASLTNRLHTAGVVPESAVGAIDAVINTIAAAPAPGIGLAVGILAAVWSASNYVKAFGRAMNRIYDVPEKRNALLLTLQMYALTAVLIILVSLVLVLLAVSGPVMDALGVLLHLESSVKAAWSAAKGPLLILLVVLIVAILYHFTPNVPPHRIRMISLGAFVAIGIAMLASAGFGFYLTFMGDNSYTRTYGAFAGIIVFLFWLWIVNLALLFGGELDAVVDHVRQLKSELPDQEPGEPEGEGAKGPRPSRPASRPCPSGR